MAASDLVNLSGLMEDAQCFALVRQRRCPENVRCPACSGGAVERAVDRGNGIADGRLALVVPPAIREWTAPVGVRTSSSA